MPEELVLITGATGHLSFRILVELLQHGYRARNAHHRPEQIDMIKAQRSIKPFRDSLEFVQVLDITAPDGYDSAIQGVDKVMHVASPMPNMFPPDDLSVPFTDQSDPFAHCCGSTTGRNSSTIPPRRVC